MIVDLEPTDDQKMIVDSIGGLVSDRLPIARLRECNGRGAAAEAAIWSELAALGLFGLGLPEESGGFGFGLPEEVLAAMTLGGGLVSPSVLATMAAAGLADDGNRAGFISGERQAAFGVTTPAGETHLYDADHADAVVLFDRGVRLLEREALGRGTQATHLDETIALERIAGLPDSVGQRTSAADRISLLLAAYLAGIAQSAGRMATDYAGTREQFGQPIGSFQAIKHMCADMAVRAAAADAQTRYAAITFGLTAETPRDVAAARWLASDAALENARANIQVHGGMGFTAECDAHLLLKRAHLVASLGSSRREEEGRLLERAV